MCNCRQCVTKFFCCVSLKRGVLIHSIFQLIITAGILIAAIVAVVVLNNSEDFMAKMIHGVASTTIFFTLIYAIVLSFLCCAAKKGIPWMILPYMIYAIIYMLEYVVVIAFSTPIYVFYPDAPGYVFTIFIVEMVLAVVGLGVQVYFYIVTCSFYRELKDGAYNEHDDQLFQRTV
ncbi:uncharacterized protein LOC143920646 [Arctopsyche grandis]|uniref:uncharacterized protein LOC143920646 n=1 Tax=Arctopsyche grandis TaxID=121162 RepID=UPI00406D78D5